MEDRYRDPRGRITDTADFWLGSPETRVSSYISALNLVKRRDRTCSRGIKILDTYTGIEYESMRTASEALGRSKDYVAAMICGGSRRFQKVSEEL
jgi:hypothetical protein